jgi:hypothetical protein
MIRRDVYSWWDTLDGIAVLDTQVTHVLGTRLSVGIVRNPLPAGAGSRLLEHTVDLLKRQALRLRDEEVGKDYAHGASRAPEEEDFGLHVSVFLVEQVRGDETDDKVPKPVRSRRESDAFGPDGEREDLADDDPGGWTPSRCEEEDVEAGEDDHAVICGSGARGGRTHDSDDELAYKHAHGSPDKERTTANLFNGPEGDWSGCDVYCGGDYAMSEYASSVWMETYSWR